MQFPHVSHLATLVRGAAEGEWDRALRWRGLIVVSGAMFVSAVDMTIVNVALPDISSDLGASIGELQWVIDGFLVALAGLLVLGSGIADRFGRRRVFLAGFAGFGVASLLAALAPTLETLIAARVAMGVGAAFVLPTALSLMAVMFESDERPRALTIWSVAAGLGVGLGPVIGGALVALAGWEWVFLVNVPAVVAVVALGPGLLPESHRPDAPPLDVLGAALSILALVGVVYGLIEGVHAGWTSPEVVGAFVAGVAGGVAFAIRELRADHPLFDVRVLRRRRTAAGAVAILSLYVAFLGMLFLVPQYLQYVQDRGTLVSGLVVLPLGLISLVVSPLTHRAIERFGQRPPTVWGLLATAAGCLMLVPFGPDLPIPVVLVGTAVFGGGLVFAVVPATAAIIDDIPAAQAGDAGAVNQLARQVGGALGVAAVGTVFAAVYAARIQDRLAGLPAPLRDRAEQSIEGAAAVAADAGARGGHVLSVADAAFDAGARAGLAFGAATLVLAAAVAFWGLRDGDPT